MDINTKTTTRTGPPLVKFGGKIWELIRIDYGTATIKRYRITARVDKAKVEPMNDRAIEELARNE